MKIFEIFKCSGQNMSNSSCQLWNDKSIPLKVLRHSSLSQQITPLWILSSYFFNFGLKDSIEIPILRLSSALVKICHICHVIFQTTSQLKVMLKCWKECSLYTNAAHWISAFWTIHCLSEVIQIPHMIFEIWSQFCINFAPFCNNLART